MRHLLLLLLFIPFLSEAQVIEKVGFIQYGKASYYQDDRKSVITQSGEKYDMEALEAGHNNLVFNSLVRITNLENGNSVEVRINDRIYSNQRVIDVTKATAEKLGFLEKENVVFNVKIEVIRLGVEREKPVSLLSENDTIVTTDSLTIGIQSTKNQYVINNNTTRISILERNDLATVFSEVGTYNLEGKTVESTGNYGIQLFSYSDVTQAIKKGLAVEKLALDDIFIQTGWKNGRKIYRLLIGDYTERTNMKTLMLELRKNGFTYFFVTKHF